MNNQTKIIAISLFGLIVSLGLFVSVIKPTLRKIDESKKEVIAKKTELKQLEEQITTFKNSQADLAQASGKDSISASLLSRENLQFAIVKVESAAAATGVEQSMVIVDDDEDPSAPKKTKSTTKDLITGKSFLTEVPYTLNTNSDFSQFINFLRYLEHLPHFTEFSAISLRSSAVTSTSSGVFVNSGEVIGNIQSIFFIQKK